MKTKLMTVAAALLVGAILSGCSGTRLISSWTASEPETTELTNVMVLSVMGGRYAIHQQTAELTMAGKLNDAGVRASSAIQVFGPSQLSDLSEQEVLDRVKNAGFTQVLMISLLDRQQELRYNPGFFTTSHVMVPVRRGPFFSNYMVMRNRVYHPGYYTTTTQYVMQAQIFNLDDETVIYQAHTSTINPGSIRNLTRQFARTIVRDMQSNGMIPGRRR